MRIKKLKQIFAQEIRLINPSIRLFAFPNDAYEITDERKRLHLLCKKNEIRLWALIDFPKSCLIQITIKSCNEIRTMYVHPMIDLFRLKKILKRESNNLEFKNARKQKENLSRRIYHLLFEFGSVWLKASPAKRNWTLKKLRSIEAYIIISESFASIKGRDLPETIITRKKSSEKRNNMGIVYENVYLEANELKCSVWILFQESCIISIKCPTNDKLNFNLKVDPNVTLLELERTIYNNHSAFRNFSIFFENGLERKKDFSNKTIKNLVSKCGKLEFKVFLYKENGYCEALEFISSNLCDNLGIELSNNKSKMHNSKTQVIQGIESSEELLNEYVLESIKF